MPIKGGKKTLKNIIHEFFQRLSSRLASFTYFPQNSIEYNSTITRTQITRIFIMDRVEEFFRHPSHLTPRGKFTTFQQPGLGKSAKFSARKNSFRDLPRGGAKMKPAKCRLFRNLRIFSTLLR